MRRSPRLALCLCCALSGAVLGAQESRPTPQESDFRLEEGRNQSHAVFVFGGGQEPKAHSSVTIQEPGGAAAPRPTPRPNERLIGKPIDPPAAPPAAGERPAGFDPAGWPAAVPAPARPPLAIDPADQAFVDLGALTMEVQFLGVGDDGQELFQRRARLELSTLPGGEERLTFPDGRVFERLGVRVQASQGRLRRPDLVEQAEAWLDTVTFFVRSPHPTVLVGGSRGSFDLLATSGGGRTGTPLVRTFGRGEERLHVFVDPATGHALQTVHSRGDGTPDRTVVLTQPRQLGECRFAQQRTVLGPDGKTPVLIVRFSQVRVRGS